MEKDLAKRLIKYFKTLGIEVYTNTKARGHQGFFLKNRIDISKSTREERIIPTLLHEFAHFIHSKLEPDMPKTGGSLEVLFKVESEKEKGKREMEQEIRIFSSLFPLPSSLLSLSALKAELMLVTNFVDENSLGHKLKAHKEQVKAKSKKFEAIIKEDYPRFMRSVKFREFDKYIKKSKAKYLLKYDRVKLLSPFLRREEIFSIDHLEQDFPDMQPAFCAYIRLKSSQRKQAKISRRINYFEKYYAKPTELFARLVEGLYSDSNRTHQLAPLACQRFSVLLSDGYYFELKEVFELLQDCPLLSRLK